MIRNNSLDEVARSLRALIGAGVSAESSIPTFGEHELSIAKRWQVFGH